MDLIEFSIACKLISCKLRNVEIPKLLPPTLVASLKHIGTPIRTPTGAMSPTESYKQFVSPANLPAQAVPPMMAPQQVPMVAPQQPMMAQPAPMMQPPMMTPQMMAQVTPQQMQMMQAYQQPELIAAQQQMILAQQQFAQQQQMLLQQQQQQVQPQLIPMAQPAPVIPPQPVLPPQPVIPTQPVMPQPPLMATPIISSNGAVVQSVKPTLTEQLSSGSLLDSLNQSQPVPGVTGALPAAPTPTPPQSGPASRSMSFSDKPPSVPESPSAEWSVPQSSKLKFTQLFNSTDKTRSGFLTGTQARGILLQTKVPQQILAQIWSLSDRDADGRLGCEEFVLALYLCEMYATGKPIPKELPPDLIPPSFRKVASKHGSVVNSRHGSVSSQGAHEGEQVTLGMISQCEYL